jgi:hydrogenase-4 component B
MTDALFLVSSVAVTVIGLLLIGFVPSEKKAGANALLVFLNAILTSIPAFHVLFNQPIELFIPNFSFFGDIAVRIDALSAWFILIINFTGITGALYGIGYMKPYGEDHFNLSLHWMLFFLFHSSMLWVCMIQQSFAFLIVWEIMSISSFLLVIFGHEGRYQLSDSDAHQCCITDSCIYLGFQ